MNATHPCGRPEARKLGYRPLTTGYAANEQWMLDRAVEALDRAGRKHVLVAGRDGVEIWVAKGGVR